MSTPAQFSLSIQDFITAAILEDTGDGDHTSRSTIPPDKHGKAEVRVKEKGILAGVAIALEVLRLTDPDIRTNVLRQDGAEVSAHETVISLEGRIQSLLQAERLLLNCMQRMSGIATLTNKFVNAVQGTGTRILDTRKTTPNFRIFEKQAVVIGGGMNHRFGLYDMILIKDNHVDACGGIQEAIRKANDYLQQTDKLLPIEIEVRDFEELEAVLLCGSVNRIMLDNFTPEKLKAAVKKINKAFETEASGGINLDNVKAYALSGVDFVSVGALTHSYKSLDIHMKLIK